MRAYFKRWDVELRLAIGEDTKRYVRNRVGLLLQRLIAESRHNGHKHFDDEVDRLYGEDAFSKNTSKNTPWNPF